MSFWPVALCVVLALNSSMASWPVDFPANKFPSAAVNRNRSLIDRGRILTSDQWGDYLIYRLYPRQLVFFDGRSDFYGEPLGKDYSDLMNAQPGWRDLMRRYDFNVALVPVTWALSELLKGDPGWRSRYHDAQAALYERIAPGSSN